MKSTKTIFTRIDMDTVINTNDSMSVIKDKLAVFQNNIFNDFKVIGEQIVNEEFEYIANTIQNAHGKKYSVLIKKTDSGWVIFPDNAEIAVLQEFGLNFPIWRKLYADYRSKQV
jgi:hypothetical protein